MNQTNEIAVARKAIRKALKARVILMDISGMHRVGIEAIRGLCKNETIAAELAFCAAKDVLFSSK